MNLKDLKIIVSILLFLSLIITGIFGYLQSELDLRKFIPHKYFAYASLILALFHLMLHWKTFWHGIKRLFKR